MNGKRRCQLLTTEEHALSGEPGEQVEHYIDVGVCTGLAARHCPFQDLRRHQSASPQLLRVRRNYSLVLIEGNISPTVAQLSGILLFVIAVALIVVALVRDGNNMWIALGGTAAALVGSAVFASTRGASGPDDR